MMMIKSATINLHRPNRLAAIATGSPCGGQQTEQTHSKTAQRSVQSSDLNDVEVAL